MQLDMNEMWADDVLKRKKKKFTKSCLSFEKGIPGMEHDVFFDIANHFSMLDRL